VNAEPVNALVERLLRLAPLELSIAQQIHEIRRQLDPSFDEPAPVFSEGEMAMRQAAATIQALEAQVREATRAMRNIKPYLVWTVSDESPGHHPTMPSAVGAFLDALAHLENSK
jgi:hypothetical protein